MYCRSAFPVTVFSFAAPIRRPKDVLAMGFVQDQLTRGSKRHVLTLVAHQLIAQRMPQRALVPEPCGRQGKSGGLAQVLQ